MNFRTRRQFAVLLVFGLVAASVAFLTIRRYAPKPTCFDNRQNQREEEVDCGGPCLACALKHQKDVEIFWTRFVKSRANTYDAAAEIRNPNVKLAARSFRYELQLFDDTGFLVASRRGISFIYPGETAHLAEVGLVTQRNVVKAKLVADSFEWTLAEGAPPDVIAGNKEYVIEDENGLKTSAVRALITNRSINDATDVEVAALVFDQDGNLVGVNGTVIGEIRANDTRPVKFAWPGVISGRVATIVMEARSRSGLGGR